MDSIIPYSFFLFYLFIYWLRIRNFSVFLPCAVFTCTCIYTWHIPARKNSGFNCSRWKYISGGLWLMRNYAWKEKNQKHQHISNHIIYFKRRVSGIIWSEHSSPGYLVFFAKKKTIRKFQGHSSSVCEFI